MPLAHPGTVSYSDHFLFVCKLFFSRTTGPISSNYPCVREIEVCSNEGLCPLKGEIITKNVKIGWIYLKIL
jgi:hypothetical protein